MKSFLLAGFFILSGAHFAKAQVCKTEFCHQEIESQQSADVDDSQAFADNEQSPYLQYPDQYQTDEQGSQDDQSDMDRYFYQLNVSPNNFPHPPPGPHPHPQPPPHPHPGPGPHPVPPYHPHPPYPPPHQPPPYYYDQYIRCESVNQYYNECFFNPYGLRGIQLVQVHSSAPCIPGRSYGFYTDRIWVDHGCRATFLIDRW